MVANATLGVDKVQGRPVVVGERAPDLVVVVDGDRPFDAHRPRLALDVAEVVLKRELRRVHADDHQAFVPVSLGPCPYVGMSAQPVDARVGPELHDHDPTTQACRGQGR